MRKNQFFTKMKEDKGARAIAITVSLMVLVLSAVIVTTVIANRQSKDRPSLVYPSQDGSTQTGLNDPDDKNNQQDGKEEKPDKPTLHLAPTSSTTAQIAMGDALAVSLMQQRGFTSVDFARLHPGGSLGRRLLMTVGNVMRDHDLPVVAPDCSAVEMIHTISKGGLGLIVICDGDRIEGIVTDGDVRRAMERLKADFFNIRAIDIATPHPKTIGADEKLIEAERLMTRNKVTSLLVTDAAGKLIGVIQIYDIKL